MAKDWVEEKLGEKWRTLGPSIYFCRETDLEKFGAELVLFQKHAVMITIAAIVGGRSEGGFLVICEFL